MPEKSSALAVMDKSGWGLMMEQAETLVPTGFLPETIKTPAQAVAIMLKGHELGVPPMYALSNIVVIKGKPACSAELLAALVYRDHGDNALEIVESTNDRCLIRYKRRGWNQYRQYQFTIGDAKTAGLLGNQTWGKYPAAMLRARCISAVARMAFQDSIGGMYTPEELGAEVTITAGEDFAVIGVPDDQPAPSIDLSETKRELDDMLAENDPQGDDLPSYDEPIIEADFSAAEPEFDGFPGIQHEDGDVLNQRYRNKLVKLSKEFIALGGSPREYIPMVRTMTGGKVGFGHLNDGQATELGQWLNEQISTLKGRR